MTAFFRKISRVILPPMSPRRFFAFAGRAQARRALRGLAAATLASLFVVSCLTPDFRFGDEPSVDAGGSPNQAPHCSNRATDADESDVDCGGLECDACEVGRSCQRDGDCENDSCLEGHCQDPTCVDERLNGQETDLDCGGERCASCADGKKCLKKSDCSSGVCASGTCAAPSCRDRVKNGNEADVDCGGDCDACDVGGSCVVDEDCEAPPVDSSATVDCLDQRCTLVCPTGQDDCNGKAADGCEVNLNTDVAHCGACGDVCDPDNAVAAKCSGGTCSIDFENGGCVAGFDDCDHEASNGCEVNLNTDEEHCGACNDACSTEHGAPTCTGGECSIACADGYDDCDSNARQNGCEVHIDADARNCDSCGHVCTESGPDDSAYCKEGSCGVTVCTNGQGDCDGDGNCTSPLNGVANCGSCGNTCVTPNATPTCTNPGSGFVCGVGTCAEGGGKEWENCDGTASNGCEVDVQSSARRCGGCLASDSNPGSGVDCAALGNNAALHIAAITCSGGGCRILGCTGDYADCDGRAINGCEVNTKSDDARCGGCLASDSNAGAGVDCNDEWAHGEGNCVDSACEFVDCDANYGNCVNGLTDGCETDLRFDEANCGACHAVCSTNDVTSANTCNSAVCVPTCSGGGQNCDSNGWNGCEDKQTDEANCGSCGTVCGTPSGTSSNVCTSGACLPSCEAPSSRYQNCDANGPNGCEDKQNDESHCGACGVLCDTSFSAHVSSNVCTTGSCVPTCNSPYQSCNGNGADGCEVNLDTDADHCGSCSTKCGGAAQTNVAARSCGAGTCSVSCGAGLCPNLASPERPCTQALGTTQNCSVCGEICQGATPFCTATGCASHLQIQMAGPTTSAVGHESGDLTFTHNLITPRTTNPYRTVVLLLGFKGNNTGLPPPVTYSAVPMTAVSTFYSGNQAWAGIYVIKDADLPASAGAKTVFVDGNLNNSFGWMAEVVELLNVDQSAPVVTTTPQGSGGSSCTAAVSRTLTGLPADSWMFSTVAVDPSATFTATSSQTLLTEHADGGGETISGYLAGVSGTTAISWGCAGSSQWAHVVVALSPEGSD